MNPATALLKPIRYCAICGASFGGRIASAIYCGSACNQMAWRLRHPGLAVARADAWNKAHPELTRERARRWAVANREKERAKVRRRRARRLEAFVADVDFETVFALARGRCHICGRPVDRSLNGRHPMSASLDHLVPLSRGGLHKPSNVGLAHSVCNKRKSAKLTRQEVLALGA